MNKRYNFVLASSSPRRQQLLSTFINNFRIIPVNIKENILVSEKKEQTPLLIAKMKAQAVKQLLNNNDIVITADTMILLDNNIYGKPKNRENAFNILKLLSGKTHSVITGVCCCSGDGLINIAFTDTTYVTFTNLKDDIINYYLDKGEYIDKAGAYAIQGYASCFVEKIDGSYDSVVGLPTCKLMREFLKNHINIFQL